MTEAERIAAGLTYLERERLTGWQGPSGDTKSLNSIERFQFSDTPVMDWKDEWGMLAVQSAAPTTGKVDVTDVLAKLDAARAAVAKIGGV